MPNENRPEFGVLDFTFPRPPEGFAAAARMLIERAKLAESFGYSRYWLTEHHYAKNITSCPEVMIGQVAAATTRIKVGSGGVLLPYYSPFKVASTFKTLHALYPDRIELGVGRGPGADEPVQRALSNNPAWKFEEGDFERRLSDLATFLGPGFPEGHPYAGAPVLPVGVAPPPVWMLGTSMQGAEYAARLGISYAYGMFLAQGDPLMTRAEKTARHFRETSAESGASGKLAVAIGCFCAKTTEEAELVERTGRAAGMKPHNIVGNPKECREDIERIVSTVQPDVLLIGSYSNIPHDLQVNSLRLLAKALRLPSGAPQRAPLAVPTLRSRR